MVEIVGLKDQNTAQLLLRFGEGAISDRDLSSSLLEAERGGRGNALESVVVDDMAVGFEMIGIGKCLVHEGAALPVGNSLP